MYTVTKPSNMGYYAMRDYTLNQIKRFVKEYIKDYDHYRAAMNTNIELDDVNELIVNEKFVELLTNPVKTSGQQPLERIEEIKFQLCDWVSEGSTLADFCRQPGMPNASTVYDWMRNDKAFEERFARARACGYDMIAMDCLRIADTPHEMYEIAENEEDGTTGHKRSTKRTRRDAINHRKLQVETRLKLLAKWDPKRYGDVLKAQVTGKDDGPIQSETNVNVDDEALARKLAFILQKGANK